MELKEQIKYIKERKAIDPKHFANNVKEITTALDMYNMSVDQEKAKDFQREIEGMNEYYAPLWKMALQEYMAGAKRTANNTRHKFAPAPEQFFGKPELSRR